MSFEDGGGKVIPIHELRSSCINSLNSGVTASWQYLSHMCSSLGRRGGLGCLAIEACDWCKLPAHMARSFRSWGATLKAARRRSRNRTCVAIWLKILFWTLASCWCETMSIRTNGGIRKLDIRIFINIIFHLGAWSSFLRFIKFLL